MRELPTFTRKIKVTLIKSYPKISIVTVNYNGARFLEDAIKSVLNQNYPNLEYIIIDGGSTDNSLDIIKRYELNLAYWVSEKDEGQYAAIKKGFDKSTGEIMAWLNSDDLYVPYSFFAVADIFNSFKEVDWLMGVAREYNANGTLISRISVPWSRWSKQRYYTYDFQFIQQESSFWRRDLWEKAKGLNMDYKYAGDMELWLRFFRYAKLHTTVATLAGFRHTNKDQRSVNFRQQYLAECHQAITQELSRFNVAKRVYYFLLRCLGFILGPFFFFDVPFLRWLYEVCFGLPKVIHYDFVKKAFTKKSQMVKLPPLYLFGKQIDSSFFKSEG